MVLISLICVYFFCQILLCTNIVISAYIEPSQTVQSDDLYVRKNEIDQLEVAINDNTGSVEYSHLISRTELNINSTTDSYSYSTPTPTSTSIIPHIFVMNLDRATTRWENIQKVMTAAELQVERLPGIDGRTLTKAQLKLMSTQISVFFQPKGVIGCYLSHRKFWQYVVDRNYSSAIIFEDDVRLIPDFKNKLEYSLQRLNEDNLQYDIVFLGMCLFTLLCFCVVIVSVCVCVFASVLFYSVQLLLIILFHLLLSTASCLLYTFLITSIYVSDIYYLCTFYF